MSTNPVYETMTRGLGHCSSGDFSVRVWRESGQRQRGPDPEVIEALKSAIPEKEVSLDEFSNLIIKAVCKLDRITAVEVVDHKGNGEVFYPDWK